ncbi:MAG: hypothetical protein K2M91_12770 [Lachnospiraceae bacterium]|nr:hypothetical protein [Lachnospiraceae bacterium]
MSIAEIKHKFLKFEYLIPVMMLATLILKCVFTAWGGNYLYADGANYCYSILRDGGPVNAIEGRQGSFWLMELPMLIAMKLGVTNIKVLCALFGIGSVMWFALFSFIAEVLCLQKHKEQFSAGVAILYVAVNIFTGFFTQIESITAVGIYVYLLVYFMLSEKKDWGYRIIALLLLPLLHHANEYFVGYSAVLVLILVTRIKKERHKIYIVEFLVDLAVSAYSIYSSYIAATQGAPTDSLMRSIRSLPEKVSYWLFIGLVCITVVLAIVDRYAYNGKKEEWVQSFSLLTGILLVLTAIYHSDQTATQSFSMRFMNLVLPCIVGFVFWVFYTFEVDVRSGLSVLAIALFVVNAVYTTKTAAAYRGYLQDLSAVCAERTGFFELRSTDVDKTFTWGWPLPMEGILAQCINGRTDIQSIVIQDFNVTYWEAFDSNNIDAYADFSRYGIKIEKQYFQ